VSSELLWQLSSLFFLQRESVFYKYLSLCKDSTHKDLSFSLTLIESASTMKTTPTEDDIDVIAQQWRTAGLSTDFNSMQIVARVLRLSKALETELAALHARYELKAGEFDVLAALRRCGEPALTPSQLYQTMLLSSGAMTSRLDRLENKQLIVRKHCSHDRRSIRVSLTAKGKTLIDTVYPAHFRLIASLLSAIPAAEKNQLSQLLRNCLHKLENAEVGSE
jgi:DNA-binding MarR family transcriptional regulator